MGAWGAGLYQDDVSADVREAFAETVVLPIPVDEIVARMVEAFGMGLDPMDEDETDFWLALADQLHRYGLDHEPTLTLAREIIASGADLRAKAALELEEADLHRRETVLQDLLEKWAAPHPKPRARRTLKGPEPFALAVGDVWVYPAMAHAAIPTRWWDYDPKTIDQHFTQDGWGAFVVFDRWHHKDYLARYLLAVAYLEGAGRPTLDEVRAAPIDGWFEPEYEKDDGTVVYADFHNEMACSVRIDKARGALRQLQAEKLGSLPVDAVALVEKSRSISERNARTADGICSLQHLLCMRSFYNNPDDLICPRYEPCRHLRVEALLESAR